MMTTMTMIVAFFFLSFLCIIDVSAFKLNKPPNHFSSLSLLRLPMASDSSANSIEELKQSLELALETVNKQSLRIAELERYVKTGSFICATQGSLKDLCQISKDACDVLTPMVRAFYQKCTTAYGTAKLKSDATFFSIADGIVQHLLVEHLFTGNKFGQIVGEEDETNVNIVTKPYTVDELVVPEEFEVLVEQTLLKIQQLSRRIDPEAYKGITIFVDPIDGTREFATGKGEFCSILVGYNNMLGEPVAGLIYRPLTNPPTWAAGAKSENCVMGYLDLAKVPNHSGVLVTDGQVSPFLDGVITELGFQKVPAYGKKNFPRSWDHL